MTDTKPRKGQFGEPLRMEREEIPCHGGRTDVFYILTDANGKWRGDFGVFEKDEKDIGDRLALCANALDGCVPEELEGLLTKFLAFLSLPDLKCSQCFSTCMVSGLDGEIEECPLCHGTGCLYSEEAEAAQDALRKFAPFMFEEEDDATD